MGYLVVTFFRQRYRLSELVKLILSYTKFLGSSVIDEVDGQWSVSSSLLAFNFFISLVASLALYLTFTKNEVVYGDSYLLQSLLLFEYSLFFASRIVNLFSQVVNIEHIRHIMKSLKSLEEMFLNIDSKQLVFDGPSMYCFLFNILIMFVYIAIALFGIRFKLVNLARMFQSFYLPIVMNTDVFTICLFIYSIQVNLAYLNSCLGTIKSKGCKDGKLHDASVEYCCKAYNELCSQVGRVNTVYGLQLLVVFINIFTVLVDELYHIIYLKSSDQIGVNFGQVIVLLLCLTYVSSLTYSITSSCERTVVKGKEFNTLLYQLMVTDKTSVMSKNKKIRLHVLMKREITFTAYGFFNIDYTLVHSIGAAVTTYLVILIQFAQPTPS